MFLDESARDNDYYFFGALIVDDSAVESIEKGLDGIASLLAANVSGFDPATEFHAAEMFHGEKDWDSVPVVWRVKASELVAKVIARTSAEFVFRGIDLNALRRRYRRPFPPHLLTLAQVIEELDTRCDRVYDEPGLVLADEHHSAANSRRNLRDFKIASVPGYTSRKIVRLADTIYFGPSHASRLLQASDVATYFLNRHRTIVEKDPRAKAAVDRIASRIRSITVSEYIWAPSPWR
ncbi:hypothetical protein CBF90_09780 [Microbacterium sp. AISO3]|uniref:DUF3800 domain-containing protein n=1 Tax=Microbacterium sp. AISO3 TaxID=2002831 RepID=UPI000B4C66FF|nr:DUF3800 domain-containing protein [Microbacterium sp. AISO3]OWP21960.1 hypothetical protein CBF90_09780 [Microbacterium sp. AISO3]